MACVAVASLLRTIELEFLQSQPRPIVQENKLIFGNKELIESLHKKLGLLMELFDEKRMGGVEAIKDMETKLRDVAFRVEDEIELLVVDLYEEQEFGIADLFLEKPRKAIDAEETQGDIKGEEEFRTSVDQPWRDTDTEKSWHSRRLCHILEQAIGDIDAIKEELVKVKMEYKHVTALQGMKIALDAFPKSDEVIMIGDSSKHASHSKDIMVGKNNEFQTIKKMLIEHPSKQLEVISIKGMAGIGKTTLAKRVYEDPLIAYHFDKRAWAVASQHHNKRQMLISLLNSMSCIESGSDEELALRLYQSLKGQRYLVVMDDVWSREAWDDLKACFPNDKYGSRVLLTTRLAKVANYTSSDSGFSHHMQLLDESESWNLFCEMVCKFHNADFETMGKQIVNKCRGLPLAIVVVAGLFSKLNTLDEWKNIVEALNSSTTTIVEACSRIFSLSYNHLPHNLKACFLYLGVFPEDHEINANDLARLWNAEGLVNAFENKRFDEVAKRNIQELMDRNLILVSKKSCCGRKIKTFRMHDLLHTFCVREAQNQNLLHIVCENSSNFLQKGFRWVSIQSEDFDIPTATLYSSLKKCRSIFYFLKETSLDLKVFNLLRVLYFTNSNMCKEIVDLVHLRYLPQACKTFRNVKLLRAWNLQTLYMFADRGSNYLEFPQLQYFNCYKIYGNPPTFVHHNMQSISWLKPYNCTKEFFRNIPYLKKVRIRGENRDCNDCIENLAYLQQLERLYISSFLMPCRGVIPINNHIVLLKNLKSLTFRSLSFEWKGINVLSKLPRLEVLRLIDFACIGEEWELLEQEIFCQLIFLKISSVGLKHWIANGINFPKLEHLLLYECYKLEKIPADFVEISTLKSIELNGCLPSALISAKKIMEEQRDYGNDTMTVIQRYIIRPHTLLVTLNLMNLIKEQRKQSSSKEDSEVANYLKN